MFEVDVLHPRVAEDLFDGAVTLFDLLLKQARQETLQFRAQTCVRWKLQIIVDDVRK